MIIKINFILLTVIFIILKFTHIVDWPWEWVFSPLFLGWILLGAHLVLLFIKETRKGRR